MVKHLILGLATLSAAAPEHGSFPSFDAWSRLHRKAYADGAERELRRAVYADTVARYTRRNAAEGPHGARYAADRNSDRTEVELQARSCFASAAPGDPARPPAPPRHRTPVFSAAELAAAAGPAAPSIDWRSRGAVTPVQQQHPFGTCWAFSLVAVAEGVMVAQGGKQLAKLSEQNVVSCVPKDDCAQTADQTVPGLGSATGGRLQLDADYPYNRTCNFVREEVLAPDGTRDGYNGTCNDSVPLLHGHCTPCPGIARIDGTPPCRASNASAFSEARLADWGYVPVGSPADDAPMVAALAKYGPLQIAIATACLHGYSGGIISNCSSTGNQGHAVTIVGAGTDGASGQGYWVVKNSWDVTFGEQGFYRVARSPVQMSMDGGFLGCFEKGCYKR